MWKRDIYHVAFIEAPYSVVASPHLASLLSPLSSLALPLLPLSPPSPGVMAAGLKYTITYQHQHLSWGGRERPRRRCAKYIVYERRHRSWVFATRPPPVTPVRGITFHFGCTRARAPARSGLFEAVLAGCGGEWGAVAFYITLAMRGVSRLKLKLQSLEWKHGCLLHMFIAHFAHIHNMLINQSREHPRYTRVTLHVRVNIHNT